MKLLVILFLVKNNMTLGQHTNFYVQKLRHFANFKLSSNNKEFRID